MSATFCIIGVCSLQTNGSGIISITASVKICGRETYRKKAVWSKHVPPFMLLSQANRTGEHCKMAEKKTPMPVPITMNDMAYDRTRNLGVLKILL